jgi:hypothetical protein
MVVAVVCELERRVRAIDAVLVRALRMMLAVMTTTQVRGADVGEHAGHALHQGHGANDGKEAAT